MTDTPEWLDQQTQERLQKLEVSVAHQKVLVNRLAEDTEVIRSRQDTVLKGLSDIQNTLKFQKWLPEYLEVPEVATQGLCVCRRCDTVVLW